MSETEKGSGGNIKIRIGGREDEQHDACIEDTWEGWDSGELDSNYEWGSGSGIATILDCGCKFLGVVWYKHAEEEDKDNVEQEDSVECQLDSAGDDFAWVGSLSDSDTDKLGSEVCEDSSGESSPGSQKSTSSTV